MISLAFTSPSSALKEGVLTSKIRTRIAEYVGIDVEYINDDRDLSEDLGLDLLDVMGLLILLEDIFLDGRLTNEADEIEVVGDLIHHIEQHHRLVGDLG
jgi:acyl carrier protein